MRKENLLFFFSFFHRTEKQNHPLVSDSKIALNIHSELIEWAEHPMPHHGLIFLGWTAACCALNDTPDASKSETPLFDYSEILSAALSCGAFSYLKSMLQSSPLQSDEVFILFFISFLFSFSYDFE